MYDVMQGVRVIEVSEHIFAPAAGMLLADWGADVVKVERTKDGGDALRHLRVAQRAGAKRNHAFEAANRGKRSIALNLLEAGGRRALHKLVEGADVFITNLRKDARRKMEIEAADLTKLNPKLIYVRASGYGTRGPMSQTGGFDYPSSWCRSGSGYAQTGPNGERPPFQPGSVGDLSGAAALAGAISAALFRRERTGKGAIVDHALYAAGLYLMSQAVAERSILGPAPISVGPAPRPHSPMVRLYKTRDGRWLSLCLLQDRWWPDLARRIGRLDLLADERFATEESKYTHAGPLTEALDETFATKTLAEWTEILKDAEGVWAPLFAPQEILVDEQALENGFVVDVTADDGFTYQIAAGPGQFDERPVGELRAAPGYGQHTDQVLSEIGFSQAELADLRGVGAIG